jgi:serpin B
MNIHLKKSLLILLAICVWAVPATAVLAQGGPVTVAASSNTFAFDLYQVLRTMPDADNLIYSPYSIAAALTMTYAGARGATAQQMADVLHVSLSDDELHSAMADVQAALMYVELAGPDEEPLRLSIANALWGQQGYPFRADYLDLLDAYYGAGLRQLDFVAAPEPARQTINDWVADETEDRIQDLLPPGSIDVDTRLVLTNAIYFKGAWVTSFEDYLSVDGPFTRLDGSTVTVPMMGQTEYFAYAALEDYQAVALPYQGGFTAMLILVPEAGHFDAFEAALDMDVFQAALDSLASTNLALTMPSFEAETDFSLVETLAALGMIDAFDPDRADFSGMADTAGGNLYVSEVVHKAFIAVDEAGTEAAAATGVVVGVTSAGPMPVELTIDRPFVYAIYDQASGAILFLGRVLDPSV